MRQKSAFIGDPDYSGDGPPDWALAKPDLPTVTVFMPETESETGLLDQHGNKLVRPRNGIGFLARII